MFIEDLNKPWIKDEWFVAKIAEFNKIHNTSYPIESNIFLRLYNLYSISKKQSHLKANFAECGVFAGMSIFFTAEACKYKYLAIDSFEGLSEPVSLDGLHFSKYDLKAPVEVAKKTLSSFNNVEIIKGWIPEALKSLEEAEYSFINVDVDLYEPTYESIKYFWPRLKTDGVLICDDYGSELTPGAKAAMLEFFNEDQILVLSTGQAIVYK